MLEAKLPTCLASACDFTPHGTANQPPPRTTYRLGPRMSGIVKFRVFNINKSRCFFDSYGLVYVCRQHFQQKNGLSVHTQSVSCRHSTVEYGRACGVDPSDILCFGSCVCATLHHDSLGDPWTRFGSCIRPSVRPSVRPRPSPSVRLRPSTDAPAVRAVHTSVHTAALSAHVHGCVRTHLIECNGCA